MTDQERVAILNKFSEKERGSLPDSVRNTEKVESSYFTATGLLPLRVGPLNDQFIWTLFKYGMFDEGMGGGTTMKADGHNETLLMDLKVQRSHFHDGNRDYIKDFSDLMRNLSDTGSMAFGACRELKWNYHLNDQKWSGTYIMGSTHIFRRYGKGKRKTKIVDLLKINKLTSANEVW